MTFSAFVFSVLWKKCGNAGSVLKFFHKTRIKDGIESLIWV